MFANIKQTGANDYLIL